MNNEQRHLVQLQQALIPVSKMVIKFGLQCHEFKINIQKAYIKAAEELLDEAGIKPTIQAIAVKTGIDRRVISDFYQNQNLNKEVMNKMDMVILALQKARKVKTSLSHSKLTTLIDKIYGNHIRAKAVITDLLSNQFLSKQANRYVINESLNQQLMQQAELANEVDVTTKRLFQTFYKKMFATDQQQDLNQATLLSSKIPHSKHDEINQLIGNKMKDFQEHMTTLILAQETNVPEGTYANIGFTQFQFDSGEH